MTPYSTDLRQKLLHAYERHKGSQRTLADLFGVSLSFVEKVLRRHRTTGQVAPKPHAGGQPRRLDAAAQASIQQWVQEQPDLTLDELCTRVTDALRVPVSRPTMCRALQRLGLPRKKRRSMPVSGIRRASSKRERTTTR